MNVRENLPENINVGMIWKRTGKLVQYVSMFNPDVPSDANMKGNDGQYKVLRPIPQDAIGLNSAVIKQNPGY